MRISHQCPFDACRASDHRSLRRRVVAAIGAAVLVFTPSSTLSDDLIVPGSGNPEFVLKQLADAFNRKQSTHRVIIPNSTGTAGALRDVEGGVSVLGRVGRPLRDSEIRRGLVYVPLGIDPVVFVAGAGVSSKNVTLQQMLDVYRGKIKDWRQLGARPGPIRAIGRESNDASRSALGKAFPEFTDIVYGPDVKLVHLDPHVYMLLDRFPTSLAFINRSGVGGAKTKLVVMALDGVEPTPENVGQGRYPATIEVGLIHKTRALNDVSREFLTFVGTTEGTKILSAHGMVLLTSRTRTGGH